MKHTILYVSDAVPEASLRSLVSSNASYELLHTSSSQAAAFLFVNRRIEAVVLDGRGPGHTCLPRILKIIRGNIPVLTVTHGEGTPAAKRADASVHAEAELADLIPALDAALTELTTPSTASALWNNPDRAAAAHG